VNKNTIKAILKKEGMSPEKQKVLFKCWDMALSWGCQDGVYRSKTEIAQILRISRATLNSNLKVFQEEFPEAYEKLRITRESCKNSTRRQYESFRKPISWDQLRDEFGDEIENHIQEKF
jgi:hypothetical protein